MVTGDDQQLGIEPTTMVTAASAIYGALKKKKGPPITVRYLEMPLSELKQLVNRNMTLNPRMGGPVGRVLQRTPAIVLATRAPTYYRALQPTAPVYEMRSEKYCPEKYRIRVAFGRSAQVCQPGRWQTRQKRVQVTPRGEKVLVSPAQINHMANWMREKGYGHLVDEVKQQRRAVEKEKQRLQAQRERELAPLRLMVALQQGKYPDALQVRPLQAPKPLPSPRPGVRVMPEPVAVPPPRKPGWVIPALVGGAALLMTLGG